MVRTILTVLLIVLLNVLVGCHAVDSGASQLIPPRMKAASVVKASEADIVEQMTISRRAYRQSLESLMDRYEKTGNNMKFGWAKNELKKLDKMPQYNYIIEAIVAGPNLKASTSVVEAELMYIKALQLEKKARKLIVIIDENLLRLALDAYNQLIKKHPSSDRIDDAAFKAARIYGHFKDYTIALLYYQRTYQWNPETIYPARFKAAYILDRHLHRRAEALELYQQAVKAKRISGKRKEFAEKRINELTKSGESSERL